MLHERDVIVLGWKEAFKQEVYTCIGLHSPHDLWGSADIVGRPCRANSQGWFIGMRQRTKQPHWQAL